MQILGYDLVEYCTKILDTGLTSHSSFKLGISLLPSASKEHHCSFSVIFFISLFSKIAEYKYSMACWLISYFNIPVQLINDLQRNACLKQEGK